MPAAALVTQKTKATPEQVFYAFTHATALREWLCDTATLIAKPGGRIYLAWNSGYTTSGEFTQIEPGKGLGFTWFGRGEPGPTLVTVELKQDGEGTEVTLTHGDIGTGDAWEGLDGKFKKDWTDSLENLGSVLETGIDLRLARRPMLGIFLNDFNAEIAHQMGIPVTEGIRIDGLMPGMGAEKAGLQKDDIMVSMGGVPLSSFDSIFKVLSGKRAGDVVEVVYYRGAERKTVQMTLSSRPMPEVPFDPQVLAEQVRGNLEQGHTDLENYLKAVTAEQAAHRPAEGEWGAREVLAHLIIDERNNQEYINELAFGEERVSDAFGGNFPARINAVVQVYPTLRDLLDLFKRTQAETVAIIAALPPEFVANKGSYYRWASSMLQGSSHTQGHLDQIKAAISSYKG